jgi:hypothetical protein
MESSMRVACNKRAFWSLETCTSWRFSTSQKLVVAPLQVGAEEL